MTKGFRAEDYWDSRLRGAWDLTGVGHVAYDERYNRWLYRRKADRLRAALSAAPQGFRALDIGSGTGWVVQRLHEAGAGRVTGVDITPTAVQRLRESFPGDVFVQGAVGADPLPGGTYDVVTALDVLYHVTDDAAWVRGLHDLAGVLAPAGCLVLSDGLGRGDRTPAEHVRFRSLARYEEAAAAAGLVVQTVKPYFSWLSRDRGDSRWSARLGRLEGPVLYALERAAPRAPHMRLAVLVRA